VVFADRITRTADVNNGEGGERSIPLLKCYTIFSVEQIVGLPRGQ
jgi:antirestriction protein ArdC